MEVRKGLLVAACAAVVIMVAHSSAIDGRQYVLVSVNDMLYSFGLY